MFPKCVIANEGPVGMSKEKTDFITETKLHTKPDHKSSCSMLNCLLLFDNTIYANLS